MERMISDGVSPRQFKNRVNLPEVSKTAAGKKVESTAGLALEEKELMQVLRKV